MENLCLTTAWCCLCLRVCVRACVSGWLAGCKAALASQRALLPEPAGPSCLPPKQSVQTTWSHPTLKGATEPHTARHIHTNRMTHRVQALRPTYSKEYLLLSTHCNLTCSAEPSIHNYLDKTSQTNTCMRAPTEPTRTNMNRVQAWIFLVTLQFFWYAIGNKQISEYLLFTESILHLHILFLRLILGYMKIFR